MNSPTDLHKFALAGNATFTVQSKKTQTRFTIRVRKPKDDSPHFVSVLTGGDNEHSYAYVGTIFDRTAYVHGKKSRISEDAPAAKAARWVVSRVVAGAALPDCDVWHEGKCGRCGRKLTVPESIMTGLGPECASKLNLVA